MHLKDISELGVTKGEKEGESKSMLRFLVKENRWNC